MKRRKLSAREFLLMTRVKRQLELVAHPELERERPSDWEPGVEDYHRMDRTLSIMEVKTRTAVSRTFLPCA